ncbi:hypothetical protein J2848_000513 [Azospirillum lipoferum]|uniref:Uncharacterized protein n=1 Tax=Azospirillum lipoferum TaxID=193 RepID=A0A5A9FZP2_AZOLI|nr:MULTISPECIES: hypothetical protein [Azospirillum]KAA0587566.1 hypothetical protein FZ942_34100 [Azospirillum lipoferum]MCP1608877.1 hypothetical protein [Azospirillum lipoferum]MDW5535808.1 hypothetical protein [Azospirillum sp. NL1]
MTVMEREDLSDTRNSVEEQRRQEADLRARKLRGRNLAVLAALLALVVLFYAITVVRMGGAH